MARSGSPVARGHSQPGHRGVMVTASSLQYPLGDVNPKQREGFAAGGGGGHLVPHAGAAAGAVRLPAVGAAAQERAVPGQRQPVRGGPRRAAAALPAPRRPLPAAPPLPQKAGVVAAGVPGRSSTDSGHGARHMRGLPHPIAASVTGLWHRTPANSLLQHDFEEGRATVIAGRSLK